MVVLDTLNISVLESEREVLLKSMPHISWPMRFILPYDKFMRFDSFTPATKWINYIMPSLKENYFNYMIWPIIIEDYLLEHSKTSNQEWQQKAHY